MDSLTFNELCDLVREISGRSASNAVDEMISRREEIENACRSAGVRVEAYAALRTMDGETIVHAIHSTPVPNFLFEEDP